MKLFAKSKLKLVSKTLMDLVKVTFVAAGFFSALSLKERLIRSTFVVILFVIGWVMYPIDDKKEENHED